MKRDRLGEFGGGVLLGLTRRGIHRVYIEVMK
jgi:hypothetical protein